MNKLRNLQTRIGEFLIYKERKEDFETVLDYLQGDYPKEATVDIIAGGATIKLNAHSIKDLTTQASERNEAHLTEEKTAVKDLIKEINKTLK